MPLAGLNKGSQSTISNTEIVGATVPGTSVVSNATTLLDGAVTELISSGNNVRDTWGLSVSVFDTGLTATASEATLDILVGGATDDVLIESLIVGGSISGPRCYYFPIHVPAGVRLAATLASVRTSITAGVVLELYGGNPPPGRFGRKVTTIGTKINNARGQAITVTASGGAATVNQLVASSAADYFAFIPGFQVSTDTTVNERNINIGIGVGAATEERIGTWWFGSDASEEFLGPFPHLPVYREVPAGTRITMLASNSGTNDAAYDGLVYAIS